jgi:hypothetical protein
MNFNISVSELKTYLFVRPRANITSRLAIAFTKTAVDMGQKINIHKHLIDVRGLSSVSGVVGKWEFANIEVKKIGLPRFWKIAALYDDGDSEVPFIETAMQNAGYNYRVFTNKKETVAWLEED